MLEFKSHIMAVNSLCCKLSKRETWNMTKFPITWPQAVQTESFFLTEWLIRFYQSCPSPCSTWSSNEEHISTFTQMLLCFPASCFKQETLCSDPGSQACLNMGLQLLLYSHCVKPTSWLLLMCTEHGQDAQGNRNNLFIHRELSTGIFLHQRKWRIKTKPKQKTNVNNSNTLWKAAIKADLQHPEAKDSIYLHTKN